MITLRCRKLSVQSLDCMLQLSFSKVLSFSVCWQVYYELDEERKKIEGKDVAICRVEQLCPFPYDLIQRELKRYPSMSLAVAGIFLFIFSLKYLHMHPPCLLNGD